MGLRTKLTTKTKKAQSAAQRRAARRAAARRAAERKAAAKRATSCPPTPGRATAERKAATGKATPRSTPAKRRSAKVRCRTRSGRPSACRPVKRPKTTPKGCVAPKAKAPKLTPTARPVPSSPNPAVTDAAPIAAPALPSAFATPAPVAPPPAAAGAPVAEQGGFGRAQAERLLWRAGFGPRPGDIERFVSMGLDAAVASLVRPSGEAQLIGPAPTDDGAPIRPGETWGHDHLWWLDRMVRSDQPLVERMTLIWHDWLATSIEKADSRLLLAQNQTLRTHALGSFGTLLTAVNTDPAMLLFLDGMNSRAGAPNENHARELMELFTLGAGRDAYTEQDVRELARTMTGWRGDWVDPTGWTNFRFDPARHDAGTKTIFGRTGRFGYDDAARLCLEHPAHASYLVARLWGAFVGSPLDEATSASLQRRYLDGDYDIAAVVEAILKHPALYAGPAIAKSPVVATAGLLRQFGRGVDTGDWAWLNAQAGQKLFAPPSVAGWDESAWIDTSTWRARWNVVVWAIHRQAIDAWATPGYDKTETAEQAVAKVLAWAGEPKTSDEQRAALLAFAVAAVPPGLASWQQGPFRAQRQNALRLLLLSSADWQVA